MKTRKENRTTAVAGMAVAAGVLLMVSSAQAITPFTVTRVIGLNVLLAGHDLNGVSLNGEILDGSQVVSVSATDADLDGNLLEALWVSKSRLEGSDSKGRFISHTRMAGVVLTASLDDGGEVRLRVEDLYRSTEDGDHDTFLYDVSYETVDGWLPLCGNDTAGDAIGAIALEGRWDFGEGTENGGSHVDDESTFTFACRGYVLAKCVEAGYKPWKKALVCSPGEGCAFTDLAAHHQACTRMLRADYCGDGTTHTVDATPVNLYDDYGVRYDSQDWSFEAEWDEDGAICAMTERITGDAPECVDWLADDQCGNLSHFADGTLLFSEVVPAAE